MARSKRARASGGAKVIEAVIDSAKGIHATIRRRKKPDLDFPMRALANVRYDERKGYFEIGPKVKRRTLEVATVKSFAQTLRMMALSKELVETDDFATKRDAYYQSKNWEEARFDAQEESDAVMDDIEALFSVRGINREMLRFYPEEKGGEVAGALVVIDRDKETGKKIRIDCTSFGSGAYSTPVSVEHLEFETKAKFILAVETGGMFQRLASHKYWKKAHCILVNMGGVPTRGCRRFIRRLSDEHRLPVYAFSVAGDETFFHVDAGGRLHLSTFDDLAARLCFRRHARPFPHERAPLAGRALTLGPEGVRLGHVRRIIRHTPREPGVEISTPQGFSISVTRSHSVTVYDSRRHAFVDKRPGEIDRRNDLLVVSQDVPRVERLRSLDLGCECGLPARGPWLVPARRGRGLRIPRRYSGDRLVALSRLLGTYAAEGHAERGRFGISFGRHEAARIAETFRLVAEVFGIQPVAQSPHDTETQLVVNSSVAARACAALAGGRAHEKRVPDFLFSAPAACKRAFLDAYLLGDGGVALRSRNTAILSAKTTSKVLAHGVIALIAQLGGTAHVRRLPVRAQPHGVRSPRGGKVRLLRIESSRPVWVVSITNRATLALFRDVIERKGYDFSGYFASGHRKTSTFESLPKEFVEHFRPLFRRRLRGRLERLLPPSAFQWRRISKDRLRAVIAALPRRDDADLRLLRAMTKGRTTLLPIARVRKVRIDGPVYDVEMAGPRRFFAGFVALHNTDCDPYGIANIYRSLKVGSGNAAHISRFFCVPQARFLGVTPQDIKDYKLPTHPLKEVDIKRARDALKNDPFFQRHKEWQEAIDLLLEMGVRAEQQALAKWGLNYVIERYLPEKLKRPERFLP